MRGVLPSRSLQQPRALDGKILIDCNNSGILGLDVPVEPIDLVEHGPDGRLVPDVHDGVLFVTASPRPPLEGAFLGQDVAAAQGFMNGKR